ncbi:phage filamentation protein Fil family protein [Brenneria goodwinii]|uniref:phage filamentation protein Fil family protein n=1 Tax=Brenneria goodwinii TaxID=1109412 RepID=UPI0036EEC0F3
MISIARLLKSQSPSPQLANHGHGWIELPNGQRWQPSACRVQFGKGRLPHVRIKRRSWWRRLMGLRG